MNSFLKRLGLFFGLLGIWVLINFTINYYLLSRPVKMDAEILIAGDSHLMSSLDPEILPNSVNVCDGAESYVATYYKVRRILDDNPQIDKVLIGFSYHNLSASQDDRFTVYRTKGLFDKYYPVFPMELPQYVHLNETKFYHSYVENMLVYPNLRKEIIVGSFKKRTSRLEEADLNRVLDRHYYRADTVAGNSKFAIQYLDSIVAMCNRRRVDLTLIATPLHIEYRLGIPEEFKTSWIQKKDELNALGIEVLDITEMDFSDSKFMDYDHLSYEGAVETTGKVRELLELN